MGRIFSIPPFTLIVLALSFFTNLSIAQPLFEVERGSFCRREAFAEPGKVGASIKNIRIIDAHAHPDRLIPLGRDASWLDKSSTLKSINALGMAASSFAAVGDQVFLGRGRFQETEFNNTKAQLDWWLEGIIKSGQARLALKAMEEVGFSRDEIAAYMGGNFYRVLRSCIG